MTHAGDIDRPYRALRISWWTAWRLRRAARVDRRSGVPVGSSVATTPVLQHLAAEFAGVCERERTSYQADVAEMVVRLGTVESELASARSLLARRTAEADRLSLPPTEDWLSRRYPGEDHLSDTATRERREVAHMRGRESARAAQFAAQEHVDALLAEQATLSALTLIRADVARSRVLRYRDHIDAKAAVYRRALLDRHPQREELVRGWDAEVCVVPGWAAADVPMPNADISGASS